MLVELVATASSLSNCECSLRHTRTQVTSSLQATSPKAVPRSSHNGWERIFHATCLKIMAVVFASHAVCCVLDCNLVDSGKALPKASPCSEASGGGFEVAELLVELLVVGRALVLQHHRRSLPSHNTPTPTSEYIFSCQHPTRPALLWMLTSLCLRI